MNPKKNQVGLGTYPFAGVFKPITKEEAKKIVISFVNNGGYYIDTAPIYGFGEVEVLLGEALHSYSREKFCIATKCGYVDVEEKTFKNVQKSAKYNDVIRECEKSLKRLNVDDIDIYFVHWPNPHTPFDETIRALTKLKKDGKIREIGVSNVTMEELREYNKSNAVKFVQNRFSLLNRSISRRFEEYMRDNFIKLVPYRVVDRGLLTSKVFAPVENLRHGDVRPGKSDLPGEKLSVVGEWVRSSLSPIAKQLNITLGQLSIAWALQQKFVDFVIVGLTNPKYIEINLESASIILSDKVMNEIDAAYKILENTILSKYKVSVREFRGLNQKYY